MSDFLPPPTHIEPFTLDEATGRWIFSPIWMQWFIDVAAFVTASGGGGGGAADHESLAGLLGGSAGQHYHTDNTQYTELVGNKAAHLVYAGPAAGGATTPAFRVLVPGDIPTGAVVAFGLDGDAGEPGDQGVPGSIGPAGQSIIGPPGLDGESGEDGFPVVGPQGATGATGATGADGAAGATGPQGPIGFGMDGESADFDDLRGLPSGDPVYAPFVQTGAVLNYLKVETVVNLLVPASYSLVVAGDYIVDGNLIINGDMRILG